MQAAQLLVVCMARSLGKLQCKLDCYPLLARAAHLAQVCVEYLGAVSQLDVLQRGHQVIYFLAAGG